MDRSIRFSDFNFTGQQSKYVGKVRDVYTIGKDTLVMVVSDRISTFDIVLPHSIPHKGQVLNQIATEFLDDTQDILPNWKLATPHPMVTIGKRAEPFKVEMVIRGYLTGHAWREYKAGKRSLCGVPMPEGMKENQAFEEPIITPTTKAQVGHDEDISREEIISSNLVLEDDYVALEKFTRALFQRGTERAAQRGLLLVDTKYEFGKVDGQITLIDEIHTPDSSRYFYSNGYQERLSKNQPQRQLSKEFVREWLMDQGFQGKEGQKIPDMSQEFIESVSNRYIELYEKICDKPFVKAKRNSLLNEEIYEAVEDYLKQSGIA